MQPETCFTKGLTPGLIASPALIFGLFSCFQKVQGGALY